MKLFSFLLGCLLSYSVTYAQVVTIPIPGSLLSLNVMANPQPLQFINNNPAATPYQLYDDGYANVPLGFTFPFFDRTFTNSTMYSNGTVQFGPRNPGNNTFCCTGITIDRNTPSAYNHSILMMQTDMYGGPGSHYSLGDGNSMTYGWYNVERLGVPQNKTSFELKIDSTGGIDMRWTGALITMNTPAIGIIGDASKGEFAVIQQGGLNQNYTIPGLTQMTTGQTPDIVIDPCTSNPLYSQTCPGYAAAYLIQQCSSNPLYSTSCSGYQAAYTEQQCSINPLYSTTCTGYATAYFTQQCSLNPLYDVNCIGYATAYLNQQCSLNPLYSTTCSGYNAAYKAQQCSISALYATDCPGYDAAYLNQQCSLDPLYSNTCTGYAAAYALKNIINAPVSSGSTPTNTIQPTNVATTTIGSDGSVSTAVSATGDTNVDKAIAAAPPSASNNSPAAVVQLSPAPAPAAPTAMAQQETKKEEPKADSKPEAEAKSDKPDSVASTGNSQQSSGDGPKKDAPVTNRQALAEKRQAQARAAAVEKGMNQANEMGQAASMEAQVQVQNLVIQAMGFTPGFDSYGKTFIQDAIGYKPYSVYGNQVNVDNRVTSRMFGGSDNKHQEMINSQYNLGK